MSKNYKSATSSVDILEIIKGRRSIRRFKRETVPQKIVEELLEAGRWAPSGLNNQPWRFIILEGEKKDNLAQFTHYSFIVKSADKLILVFLDKEVSYHRDKDLMAIGACIQNILLYAHTKKLGACWLGEILNKKEKIHGLLNTPKKLELVACIAIGVPLRYPKKGSRKNLKSLILS